MVHFSYHFLIGKVSFYYFKCTFRLKWFYQEKIVILYIYSFRFPFEWKNPSGSLIAFILIYILQMNLLFFMTCSFCIGVGVYMFITSLTKDLKYNLTIINKLFKAEQNPTELLEQLFNWIQFHSKVKR